MYFQIVTAHQEARGRIGSGVTLFGKHRYELIFVAGLLPTIVGNPVSKVRACQSGCFVVLEMIPVDFAAKLVGEQEREIKVLVVKVGTEPALEVGSRFTEDGLLCIVVVRC